VIGANGSGKTTLLRVIAGEEQPDEGRVVVASERIITYLAQNPPSDDDQSVIEAVFAGNNETLRQKLQLLRDYEIACHDLAAHGGTDEKLLARVADRQHQLEHAGAWELETEAKAVLGTRHHRPRGKDGHALGRA